MKDVLPPKGMKICARRISLLTIVLSSLLCGGCGDDSISFDVLVQSLPAGARSIEVTSKLNGEVNQEGVLVVTRRLDRFSVRVPAAARGILRLHVSALRDDACAVASGELRLKLGYPGRSLDAFPDAPDILVKPPSGITLQLTGEAEPCRLAVAFSGQGNQKVTSTPGGIECTYTCVGAACQTSGRCSQVFPAGQQVSLSATGTGFSYLNDWQGACSGKGACIVEMRGDSKVVTAEVTPQQNCTTTSWCDADLLPCGGETTAVWVHSATDYYVARRHCGLWHFDGTDWSRVVMPSTDLTSNTINAIWSDGTENIWAVGEGGYFVQIKKSAPTVGVSEDDFALLNSSTKTFSDVAGSKIKKKRKEKEVIDDVVLALANTTAGSVVYAIDESDSENKVTALFTSSYRLHKIWSDGEGDVWLAASYGMLYHKNLTDLTTDFQAMKSGDTSFIDITGRYKDDVWFLSESRFLKHYDGKILTDINLDGVPPGYFIKSIRSTVRGEVWLSLAQPEAVDLLYRYKLATGALLVAMPFDPWAGGDYNAWVFAGSTRDELWMSPEIWNQKHPSLWHRQGDAWQSAPPDAPREEQADAVNFVSIVGSSAADLWLLSDEGRVFHRNRHELTAINRELTAPFKDDKEMGAPRINALWAENADNVWMVGERGAVFHYDGTQRSWLQIDSSADLTSIYGTGYDNVWVGGEKNTLLHWDGNRWAHLPISYNRNLADAPPDENPTTFNTGSVTSIIGKPGGDVIFLIVQPEGDLDQKDVLTWNGKSFQKIGRIPQPVFQALAYKNDGLWINQDFLLQHINKAGFSAKYYTQNFDRLSRAQCLMWSDEIDLYSTCQASFLASFPNSENYNIRQIDTGSSANLRAIWGKDSDIWAVGDHGVILRYHPLRIQ